MNRGIVYYTIALVLVCCMFNNAAFAEDPGLPFLRVAMDARGAAMGSAGAASTTGLSALHWNPAGIAAAERNELMFSHSEGFEDTGTEYFGVLWKNNNGRSFAISVLSNNIDNIEFRTSPTPTPDGIISAHDLYAGASYAAHYGENIQYGVSVKYLYQKIYQTDASGFAADFGIMYAPKNRRFSIGASLMNSGSMSELKNESTKLPALMRIGGTYDLSGFTGENHTVEVSADYETVLDGDSYFHTGAGYRYMDRYFAGIGFISGYESGRLTAGGGIRIQRYVFDYAFLPKVTSFGNRHLFSFKLLF